MKWVNSTALAEKRFNIKLNFTVFNYVDEDKESFGIVTVSRSGGIRWFCMDSNDSADSVGQAKNAVEKLIQMEAN